MAEEHQWRVEGLRRSQPEGGHVKVNTFLALDPADPEFDTKWEAMSAVRHEFVADEGPATLGVPVPALRYPGLLVEVDAMAVIRDHDAG